MIDLDEHAERTQLLFDPFVARLQPHLVEPADIRSRKVRALADLREHVREYREKLIEGLAEVDEHLMAKYVHSQPITPAELRVGLRGAGLALTDTTGMIYNPFADEWRLGRDTDVNYFATAVKG